MSVDYPSFALAPFLAHTVEEKTEHNPMKKNKTQPHALL